MVCSVSRCFCLVYTSFWLVMGAFVWYLAVNIEWSDWPVLYIVTCVTFWGQFEWSIHDMGVWFMC